ncbi:TlpA disulfide reductase family protein [Pedobacter nyackensis]|nr:TlpA disulfide reductase family protein [Pedobacter nyackensis]
MRLFNSAFLLLSLMAPLSVLSQHIKFSKTLPEAGDVIKFVYDPVGTNLAGKNNIECDAFLFTYKSPGPTKIRLIKEGGVYKGEVPTTDSTNLVALAFSSEKVKDDFPEGYFVKLSKNGKIPGGAYINEAYVYDFFGRYYLGMKANSEKAISAYNEGFRIDPKLKRKSLISYLRLNYMEDKETGGKMINDNINKLAATKPETEENLVLIGNMYSILKQKPKADSMFKVVIAKFPQGPSAMNSVLNSIYAEKAGTVMEQRLNEFIQKFGLDMNKDGDRKRMSFIFPQLARVYANEKKYDKFKQYANKIDDKARLADLYNIVAWDLAEKNEETALAADLSKKSLDLATAAKNDEVPIFYFSKEQYLDGLTKAYANYADTYALIMHNMGNNAEALVYQEKAKPFDNVSKNERYVMYLDLTGNKEKAFTTAESYLRAGNGTDQIRERFKVLYESKKLKEPFETYLAGVEKMALAKEREEWAKKMINMPAPDFSLRNLKGELVKLSDLKGKVVIVDYWATWCGPCVASFPGMQKAVTKYAADPNVVFLFVNTWQTEDNREKLVGDFIAEKKVSFNVLFDTKNKQDPSKFDVVSAYKVDGIPTKYIIGPDGNIRFKSTGFSGSADAVVRELDTMIGMVLAGGK